MHLLIVQPVQDEIRLIRGITRLHRWDERNVGLGIDRRSQMEMQSWRDTGPVVAVRMKVVDTVCGRQRGNRRLANRRRRTVNGANGLIRSVKASVVVLRVASNMETRFHVLQALHKPMLVSMCPKFGVLRCEWIKLIHVD